MIKQCYFYDWIIKDVAKCNICNSRTEKSCQGYFGSSRGRVVLYNSKRFLWVYFENEIYISHYKVIPRINDFINESDKGMNI
jgi:hypothetical protein